MEWESPDADPAPGRRLTGIAVVLVGVAVVGLMARSPATAPDPGLAVDGDRPPPTSAASPAVQEEVPVVLQGDVPVVEGEWESVPAEVGGETLDPAAVQVEMVWVDGEVVVVTGTGGVAALDPSTGTWRDLPRVPAHFNPPPERQTTRQVAAIDAGVLLIDGPIGPPTGGDPEPVSAWWLDEGRWAPVAGVDGHVIGTAGGGAVIARYAVDPEGEPRLAGLSTLDPASGTVVELPTVPVPFEPARAVEVPDGFVVWGGRSSSARGQTVTSFAALRWSTISGEWTVLPPPPVRSEDAEWVPGPAGSAGRLVTAGPRVERDDAAGLAGAVLDLDRHVWSSVVDAPLDGADARLVRSPSIALAWDGQDTVWAYGGYGAAVLLGYELPTAQLAQGPATGPRIGAELVWHDGRLVLFGGYGVGGQLGHVEVWQPAG